MEINSIVTKQDLKQNLEAFRHKILCDLKDFVLKKVYPSKAFYSPKEFSALTGIPYATVMHRCKNGKLKARQEAPNCSWQICAEEIERYNKEASENI